MTHHPVLYFLLSRNIPFVLLHAVCIGGSGNGVAKSVAYENEEAAAGDALLQVPYTAFFPRCSYSHELIS
jgi:hypothetical protein